MRIHRGLSAVVLAAGVFCLVLTGVGLAQPYQGQTLTLLYFEATYADAARAVIPEFEARTGAKVTLVTAPYFSLYEKSFLALFTGSREYDVVQVAYQWDGQFAPYLASIEPYLARDPRVNMDDFVAGVARSTGTWGGVRFGVPNASDAYGIIYRTDLFARAGIAADPGWSWEDYEAAARRLTSQNLYGTTIAGAKEQLDAFWTARYWSQGGHLMSPDWQTALPQRETAVRALQQIRDLMSLMPPGVLSYNIPDENAAFTQGRVAMAELWPSLIRAEADDSRRSRVAGQWNILPYPGATPQLSAWSLAIPKASQKPDLAWEWIAFYTSEENQRRFLAEFGIGPTRQAIYQDPGVVAQHRDFPTMLISLNGARPRLRIAQSQHAFDFLDERINDALTGVMSPREAVEAVGRFWEEIISPNPPGVPFTGDYLPPFDR